ncbi:MAG TPA: hypothetical protein PLT65_04785 [Bacilli bacterium]|nr:hypothetical protein [Bacilli bacterium]
MKKIGILLVGVILLLATGCGNKNNGGNLDEGWNGLYKSDSDYYIMLYTNDNEKITFNVIQHNKNMTLYPVQYDSAVTIKNENTLEYNDTSEFFGETQTTTINVTKNGNTIVVTASDTDSDSALNKINGTYTKYGNVNSSDVDEFKAP